jgi:hypothetical protein
MLHQLPRPVKYRVEFACPWRMRGPQETPTAMSLGALTPISLGALTVMW